MNGAHDMGGMMGFGPVVPEVNEPVFHGTWEERVMAMTLAMAMVGGWNIDQSRSARENVLPPRYLSQTYYEIWFAGLTRLLAERGLVGADELAAGQTLHPANPNVHAISPEELARALARGRPSDRPVAEAARFKVGDCVRTRNINPAGHTRLPRYARNRTGIVTMLHGAHCFPDANATGTGEAPQWLYTVRFTGRELWGEQADPTLTVSVDAWDSYLEPAS
jgi:nitrile hydratase